MTVNDINWWPKTPESSYLNPIENIWADLKQYLGTKVKLTTKDELIAGIYVSGNMSLQTSVNNTLTS